MAPGISRARTSPWACHGSETSNVVLTLTEGERRDVILEFQSEDVTAQVQDDSRATSPGQD